MALHRGDVPVAYTTDRVGRPDEVEVITLIDVGRDIHSVLEDTHVDTEVELMLLFVG